MASTEQLTWLQAMVAPAQATQRKYGVPASVTLAQCILESAWGTSQLARRCKNYFGIKAVAGQPYEEFTTREVVTGRSVKELARFAKYRSVLESFEAHAHLLSTHYAKAMQYADNPVAFCVALRLGGYSTEPRYSWLLTELITQFDLDKYDVAPQPDKPVAAKEAA